nr:zinc finger, CCHC-type [Tanacetum cinerariifolium]
MHKDGGDNPTVDQVKRRAKWDNNDYVCRGLILNAKYMVEDASSKKFLVSNFTNYKMSDSRPVLEQYNELLGILRRLGHIQFKKMQDMSKDGLIPAFDMNTEKWNKKYFVTFIDDASRSCYVYLLNSKNEALDKFKVFKTEVELQQGSLIKRFKTDRRYERGIECIFVGYAEHSKAFRLYVIKPNDSVAINTIIESRDAIFDEIRFSSVHRQSQEDVALWKETINAEMDSIMGNNIWVLTDLPPGCRPLGCKWIFKRKLKLDGTVEKFKARLVIQGFKQKSGIDYFDAYAPVAHIRVIIFLYVDDMLIFGTDQVHVDLENKFLSSRFSMKDMGEVDVILVSTLMDTSEKLMPNKGQSVSQLEYSRVIGCLMYSMTCTRHAVAFVVASKRQTCITGSIMESKFMALAAGGKDTEWLKNLLLEIPLWVKPITPISIRCDIVATLAKAYRQMYNGKSRYLGIRHNMIRELITNERTEAHVLQIIRRMCLKPAKKEDDVVNFLMVNVFEKVLSRNMNKEEPPRSV